MFVKIAQGGMTTMPEIFQYDFMRKAFVVGIIIGIITPCIGIIIVLKRFSMIGDALSHSSLAGVTAGLVAGINPVLGAVLFSVIASLGIEKFRKSFSNYSEIAVAIITSTAIGLAGILSGFIKNSASFTSFLFGSIVAISNFELYMIVLLGIIVILCSIFLYKELFYMIFDEESARLSGIPVNLINFVFMLLTAITVSISTRTVGALIISSLMILPVAISMQLAKSYKNTLTFAVIIGVFSTVFGLVMSYYGDLKPGGTIVLVNVVILVCILVFKNIQKNFQNYNRKNI